MPQKAFHCQRRVAVVLAAALLGGAAAPDRPRLVLPLRCEIGRDCEVQNYVDIDPGPGVKDYRCRARTYDGHSGVDFRLLDMAAQRTGVDVLAAAAGRVARVRDGVADISIRDPGAADPSGAECGNGVVIDHGGGWETQYCHMARSSVRVRSGDLVAAGDPIGRVGLSGSTEFPHLHLTVRKQGGTVDPFAPDARGGQCGSGGGSLWTVEAAQALSYSRGAILNGGFSDGPVSPADIEQGGVRPPDAAAPALVAWIRAIGLEGGDVVELTLRGPGGDVLAERKMEPLDRDKAQQTLFVGRKRPAAGWKPGAYEAQAVVRRGGNAVVRRSFRLRL